MHVILSAWGNSKLTENNFNYNPYGNGWNLNRLLFDAMLLESAKLGGAQVVNTLSDYECFEEKQSHWKVAFKGQEVSASFITRFIVDATGRASSFAKKKRSP